LIAIGDDEAPKSGTIFLISFLNVGHRINAAYYFTTFANVSQGDSNNFSKTFGPCADSNFDWTPI